jgi:hypothetical protein
VNHGDLLLSSFESTSVRSPVPSQNGSIHLLQLPHRASQNWAVSFLEMSMTPSVMVPVLWAISPTSTRYVQADFIALSLYQDSSLFVDVAPMIPSSRTIHSCSAQSRRSAAKCRERPPGPEYL